MPAQDPKLVKFPDWMGTPARRFSNWTKEEEKHLSVHIKAGESFFKLAKLHGRNPGALVARLKKIDTTFKNYHNHNWNSINVNSDISFVWKDEPTEEYISEEPLWLIGKKHLVACTIMVGIIILNTIYFCK